MTKKYPKLEKLFLRFASVIFVLSPIIIAALIFLLSPANAIFGFFILLIEFSLLMGIRFKFSDHWIHAIVAIIGLFISAAQAYIFASKFGFHNGVIGFLVYEWVWLSMYIGGLDISVTKVDYMKLFTTLTITFGSMGAITWFWFSHIF